MFVPIATSLQNALENLSKETGEPISQLIAGTLSRGLLPRAYAESIYVAFCREHVPRAYIRYACGRRIKGEYWYSIVEMIVEIRRGRAAPDGANMMLVRNEDWSYCRLARAPRHK